MLDEKLDHEIKYVNIIFSKLIFGYPLFELVAEYCFGMKLDISYNEKINRFEESMLHLKPYVNDIFAKNISLGWKFHLISEISFE